MHPKIAAYTKDSRKGLVSNFHIACNPRNLSKCGNMTNSGHNCTADQHDPMCDGSYGEQIDDPSDSITYSISKHNFNYPTVKTRVCR